MTTPTIPVPRHTVQAIHVRILIRTRELRMQEQRRHALLRDASGTPPSQFWLALADALHDDSTD